MSVGVVGSASGRVQLTVAPAPQNATLVPLYADQLDEESTFYSDEAHRFQPLAETVEAHHTGAHGQNEYALDLDDDDHHEVHNNTIESVWSTLRNFLRPFRVFHKRYLPGYVAMFDCAYDLASVTADFLRTLVFPDYGALPTLPFYFIKNITLSFDKATVSSYNHQTRQAQQIQQIKHIRQTHHQLYEQSKHSALARGYPNACQLFLHNTFLPVMSDNCLAHRIPRFVV